MLGSSFDLFEFVSNIAERRVDQPPVVAEPDVDILDRNCAELEREMVEMAVTLHSSNTKIAVACPVCDSRMSYCAELSIEELESHGATVHELECSTCGMTTGRVFHPAIGYHVPVR